MEEKGGDEELARIENVEELKTNILSYIAENEDGLLAGFLDEVALYADIDNYDRDADSAVMMTMHSAKGLEFDTVFIVGAEEGIFPGLRAIGEPDEMEEERRLCYVAVTRARKKLYICCASRRTLFGKTLSNRVSRFVDEIPEDDIEKPKRRTEWTFGDESDGGSARLKPGQMPAGAPRVRPVITPETVRAPAPDYREGDMVDHSAFGRGMIVTMTPMGGDHLVEVAFDRVGTKRLMLRAASLHMKKIK